jgi:hypothetical protein
VENLFQQETCRLERQLEGRIAGILWCSAKYSLFPGTVKKIPSGSNPEGIF